MYDTHTLNRVIRFKCLNLVRKGFFKGLGLKVFRVSGSGLYRFGVEAQRLLGCMAWDVRVLPQFRV